MSLSDYISSEYGSSTILGKRIHHFTYISTNNDILTTKF